MNKQLTTHFNASEFRCKCGKCADLPPNTELVERLEKVYEYLNETVDGVACIIITSGRRCPSHSLAVGGSVDDAHTIGIAADFYAVKGDGETRWNSYEVAVVCERVGFNGIGIIDNTCVHADVRTSYNYKNAHWFGNEQTGNDNISSFSDYLPRKKGKTISAIQTPHKIVLYLDDKKIYECEV